MTRRLLVYFFVAIGTFIISFGGNYYILGSQGLQVQFSLLSVYLFHVVFSLLIYTTIELTASKLPTQAGYAYLVGVFIKMGFFILIFSGSIFGDPGLQKFEKLSMVVPLFLYLIIEAIASSRLLNKS